ncbi:dual specificity protein phosphatase 12-like [Planoprotostelium fungivorum]|uniref:protein-tyrosine-phosphatase n=1 Tax=Planoprotostelium fungivorum TaxID=1890364 RepID=A0A2P6N5Z1_9EUKA|nr:dual specificity protein phosphatase 12-like [Planoprotostelium fungivorum]
MSFASIWNHQTQSKEPIVFHCIFLHPTTQLLTHWPSTAIDPQRLKKIYRDASDTITLDRKDIILHPDTPIDLKKDEIYTIVPMKGEITPSRPMPTPVLTSEMQESSLEEFEESLRKNVEDASEDELLQKEVNYMGNFDEITDQIVDGLWLGDCYSMECHKQMHIKGITHVISVANGLKPITNDNLTQHIYSLPDVPSSNLLEIFDETSNIIDSAREKGAVLVHCMAGVSRSASVVVAYIMKTFRISRDEAIQLVRARRNQIYPNQGFMNQLKEYETMGCELREDRHIRSLQDTIERMKNLAFLMESEGRVRLEWLKRDPNNSLLKETEKKRLFVCASCQRPLFLVESLLHPTEGLCNNLFLEPMQWMHDQISGFSGQLQCPQCRKRLGSYSWTSSMEKTIECSCHHITVPAFNVWTSRVLPAGRKSWT